MDFSGCWNSFFISFSGRGEVMLGWFPSHAEDPQLAEFLHIAGYSVKGGVCLRAEDPQLAEFLQLMQPRRAGNLWSNEDATLATPAPGKGQLAKTGFGSAAVGEAAGGGAAQKPSRKRQADTGTRAGDDAVLMHILTQHLRSPPCQSAQADR